MHQGKTNSSLYLSKALAALVLGALVIFVLLLIVAPLLSIIYRGFFNFDDGALEPTLQYVREVFTERIYWIALWNTLSVSIGATFVATSLGSLMGWIYVRTDTPFRSFLEPVSQLPIFIPPFVGAVAWALLAAPRSGTLNKTLATLGLPDILDVYTHFGILLVVGIYLAPYVMMIVEIGRAHV